MDTPWVRLHSLGTEVTTEVGSELSGHLPPGGAVHRQRLLEALGMSGNWAALRCNTQSRQDREQHRL